MELGPLPPRSLGRADGTRPRLTAELALADRLVIADRTSASVALLQVIDQRRRYHSTLMASHLPDDRWRVVTAHPILRRLGFRHTRPSIRRTAPGSLQGRAEPYSAGRR